MINNFFGFEMGKRALSYFRQGFETSGHNISNADVEGYSRQRVEASSTYPFTDPAMNRPAIPGQIGTGVKVDAIVRLRDQFLDLQYREETTVKGYWDIMTEALDTLETFVNEPNGESVRVGLDEFWSALQEASKFPDSSSARENLISKAGTLGTYLDSLARNYEEYRTNLNDQLALTVEEANTYIDQIAALNVTIREVEGVGGNPNDLYDRRDLLAEKLCSLIDSEVSSPCDMDDGEYKIYLGGRILVQGDKSRHLKLVSVTGNEGFFDVQVEDNTFEHVSDTEVLTASIGQDALEAIHSVAVERLASETTWKIGGGDINGAIGRLPVSDPDASMNIEGTVRLQVGTSGTRATGSQLDNQSGSPVLLSLPGGDDPTEYVFRIASQDLHSLPGNPDEMYVTVEWNSATSDWEISSRCGTSTSAGPIGVGNSLDLNELQDFLQNDSGVGGLMGFNVETSGTVDRLVVRSGDDHLLSFNDMKGDLLSGAVGLSNDSPVVTVEIEDGDSLRTVANKINGAYNNGEGMPDDPSEWLHASIETNGDGDFYLVLESDIVGEGNRINVMGSDKGDSYAARRLGLMSGDSDVYDSEIISTSTDALLMVDNEMYLSSFNDFRQARKLSPEDGYSASTMSDVSKGIVFHLKGTGTSTVRAEHHVTGGEIKSLMEVRDDVILQHLESFDAIAYNLVNEMNAVHYAGHGTGEYSEVTGTAFFSNISTVAGASRNLSVNDLLSQASGLFAAAADDGDGQSKGEGNGDNAIAMAQLKQAKVMAGDSATFNEYYEDFIARLGVESQRSQAMLSNQTALVDQIESQRQSVMGVNIDEEMMNIMQFQQSFNAISRYVTTLDEMLDKVINGMGRVGL
ncbi:flagellar hook-associated protein FlgK [Dethiosulfovibrio sp. F2B]|uniref:flagellar hook-associated protein FlgK n=1 Tax=Dethiosulfovibrio faecalis TaxID=2720018 RepID=UPI001F45027A|nr:flagellar hook-associated protein FlgK [Dethiosulfovibrio faecalis]MCF4152425.1 flagellar hook-associated protein FlgK [Dethiosulfovibrio faecalis]